MPATKKPSTVVEPSKHAVAGPGIIVDRSARKGKVVIDFDSTPDAFLAEARIAEDRVIVIIRDDLAKRTIRFSAVPKRWLLLFHAADIEPGDLALIEEMITDTQHVHIGIEYRPTGKLNFDPPNENAE